MALEPPGAAGVAQTSKWLGSEHRVGLLACPASPQVVRRRRWCPLRLLGASGCSLSPAWRRMPTMHAVFHAASAHAGARMPARCRKRTLLEATGQ